MNIKDRIANLREYAMSGMAPDPEGLLKQADELEQLEQQIRLAAQTTPVPCEQGTEGRVANALAWLDAELATYKHATDGPWAVTNAFTGSLTIWNGDVTVATVPGSPFNSKCQTNAQLMANTRTYSPVMLDVIRIAIEAFARDCSPFRFPDEDRPLSYTALNEILTKIESIQCQQQ